MHDWAASVSGKISHRHVGARPRSLLGHCGGVHAVRDVSFEVVAGEVSTAFSSEYFDKHQEVWAEVVATDSQGISGDAVESKTVSCEASKAKQHLSNYI